MKKWLCFILALLMLVPMCACGGAGTQENGVSATEAPKRKKPQILIDAEWLKNDNEILQYTQYLNVGYTAQIKCLSSDPEKREMELSSMRAEIMAGGGPDVFVMPCYMQNGYLSDGITKKEPLFLDIEKAMQSKIFLPLDDLIEQSESINMEEHYEVIMEAGKTEEGQVVLPLSFYVPAYFVDRSKVKDPYAAYDSWDELLNSDDSYTLSILKSHALNWYGTQYTLLADYENENLLITPEKVKADLIDFSSISSANASDLEGVMDVCNSFRLENWAQDPEAYSVVPVMNEEGGLTACISSFAAINRNSELVEGSFKYIETMFREEVQNNEGIVTGDPREGGRYMGNASRPDAWFAGGVLGIATGKTAYPEAEAELISGLVEKINAVRFASELDGVFTSSSNRNALFFQKDEAYYEEAAENICDEMNMILAE